MRTERWDFTRGDGPYACWRIGLASRLPLISPMRAIARVPLSNPAAALELSALTAAPKSSACRASRPALARPEWSASESDGQGAVAAARAAPRGRLETVQKVLTRERGQRGQRGPPSSARPRPICGTVASLSGVQGKIAMSALRDQVFCVRSGRLVLLMPNECGQRVTTLRAALRVVCNRGSDHR